MQIEIDPHSGFCFGVVRAIELAEKHLYEQRQLLCLGDIVHNSEEVNRLQKLGLQTIQHQDLTNYSALPILFRAHGEPPATYQIAKGQNLQIIDATCPVVLQLQRKVKERGDLLLRQNGQIIIFGKPDHAEVNGLLGQTSCLRHVVQTTEDLQSIDFSKPTDCFSQTTMNPEDYLSITREVRQRMQSSLHTETPPLKIHHTICARVANRREQIAQFARTHEAILFVSGKKSSNGKVLFQECKSVNSQTHFICNPDEIDPQWLRGVERLGISGATSTPRWLMEETAKRAERFALHSR